MSLVNHIKKTIALLSLNSFSFITNIQTFFSLQFRFHILFDENQKTKTKQKTKT